MMFGKEANSIVQMILDDEEPVWDVELATKHREEKMIKAFAEGKRKARYIQEKHWQSRNRQDELKKLKHPVEYQIGEKVMIRNVRIGKIQNNRRKINW